MLNNYYLSISTKCGSTIQWALGCRFLIASHTHSDGTIWMSMPWRKCLWISDTSIYLYMTAIIMRGFDVLAAFIHHHNDHATGSCSICIRRWGNGWKRPKSWYVISVCTFSFHQSCQILAVSFIADTLYSVYRHICLSILWYRTVILFFCMCWRSHSRGIIL